MNPFWDNLVGHTSTVAQLQRLISRSQVPHALLFSGTEAVGKRAAAQAFASSLLTAAGAGSRDEESLRLLKAGNHPDFRVLAREEGKKDITVESTRKLCTETHLRPYYGRCSVSVIDNAHEMNLAASNALLMTLEEPSAENYLILISHAPQRLPATILSRCHTVHFGELSPDECSQLVSRLPVEPAKQQQLLNLCAGSLAALDLSRFVHPSSLTLEPSKALLSHLESLIGSVSRLNKEIENFLGRYAAGSPEAAESLSLAAHLTSDSDELPLVWRLLHNAVRGALRKSAGAQAARWARLLELSLQAEKLCRERNTSPQLQMSSLLLAESNA